MCASSFGVNVYVSMSVLVCICQCVYVCVCVSLCVRACVRVCASLYGHDSGCGILSVGSYDFVPGVPYLCTHVVEFYLCSIRACVAD